MISFSKPLTVLITGSSRGIGRQLSLIMSQKLPQQSHFILTTRHNEQQNKQLQQSLSHNFPKHNYTIKTLQITSQQSINKFVSDIKIKYNKIDVLVNNAAVGYVIDEKPNPEVAQKTFYSNLIGPMKLTNLILENKMLAEKGRIMNVSSQFGGLRYHSKEVQEQFTNKNLEQQQIFNAVDEYINSARQNNLGKWYKSTYCTSKMLMNAWTRFPLKRKLTSEQVAIVASPGYCKTDMSGPDAYFTAESGAQCIYNRIFMEKPTSDVFYHRDQQVNYNDCGPVIDFL